MFEDHRGHFVSFPFVSAQVNLSFTKYAGTVRGLHYREPLEEKMVLCTRGSIYDITVDLETGEWFPLYMGSSPRFIPKGFAHGFQALEDNTEVFYVVSESYDPLCERGIRYDSFGVKWPLAVINLSSKDRGYDKRL
jgi:dTDP-4-dehydrorhamnose 3,5-epimerase